MYLNFDNELSPLSAELRGAYFDREDGGGGGGERKRSAFVCEAEEEKEARVPEKRFRMHSVQSEQPWDSRSFSVTSQSMSAAHSFAPSSSPSNLSLSTFGSPLQNRYRHTWDHLDVLSSSFSLCRTPCPLSPTATSLHTRTHHPNAYPTSEDNSFGLSFSTHVDPFGLGGHVSEWWDIKEEEDFHMVDVKEVKKEEESTAGVSTATSLGWSTSLNWSSLSSSSSVSKPYSAFPRYSSSSSTPSDHLPISPTQTYYHSPPPPSHHHLDTDLSSTSHFLQPHPPPAGTSHHLHDPDHSYLDPVDTHHYPNPSRAFPTLPARTHRPSTASSSLSSEGTGEDFASALVRIRKEQGPFMMTLPA